MQRSADADATGWDGTFTSCGDSWPTPSNLWFKDLMGAGWTWEVRGQGGWSGGGAGRGRAAWVGVDIVAATRGGRGRGEKAGWSRG